LKAYPLHGDGIGRTAFHAKSAANAAVFVLQNRRILFQVRVIAELRTEVADLALRAAGHVVGETITSDREKRLVNEFLAETGVGASGGGRSSASKRGGSGGGATG